MKGFLSRIVLKSDKLYFINLNVFDYHKTPLGNEKARQTMRNCS
jgi:hypothetical protein